MYELINVKSQPNGDVVVVNTPRGCFAFVGNRRRNRQDGWAHRFIRRANNDKRVAARLEDVIERRGVSCSVLAQPDDPAAIDSQVKADTMAGRRGKRRRRRDKRVQRRGRRINRRLRRARRRARGRGPRAAAARARIVRLKARQRINENRQRRRGIFNKPNRRPTGPVKPSGDRQRTADRPEPGLDPEFDLRQSLVPQSVGQITPQSTLAPTSATDVTEEDFYEEPDDMTDFDGEFDDEPETTGGRGKVLLGLAAAGAVIFALQ